MTITRALILATATKYTVEQLQQKIEELLTSLEGNGTVITSASTGAGASYSRQIEASRIDMLELYRAALDYKTGQDPESGAVYPVWFAPGPNR